MGGRGRVHGGGPDAAPVRGQHRSASGLALVAHLERAGKTTPGAAGGAWSIAGGGADAARGAGE